MAVRLTYTGTPYFDQIRQQGFTTGKPTGGFSTRLADFFQKGPKTFTAPSLDVARTYAIGKGGGVIPVVSSTSNLRLPSGGIPETTIGRGYRVPSGFPKFGTEVVMSPKQATAGMKSFDRMKERYSKSPTFNRLMRGEVVSGLGGKNFNAAELAKSFGKGALTFLTKAASKASLPFSVLSSTPANASEVGMTSKDFAELYNQQNFNPGRGDYTRASNEDFQDLLDMGIGSLNQYDEAPASSGVRQTIGSRITEGLGSMRDTITDKFGSGLDFLKNLSPVQNIINAVKRGDESTRGVAGLNVNDVFNINTFGTEEDPTKDPYGINIVSARGDYNEYVKNKARELAKMQFRTKSGQKRQQFYADAAEKIREEEKRKEEARRAAIDRAQKEFYASDDPGRGPRNNPQGGLGRQDYSRAPSSAFADLL